MCRALDSYFNIIWALSQTRVMENDEACLMHLTPGVVHNLAKAVGVSDLYPYAQQDPIFLFEKRKGNPRNSGLLSQQ